jgi:hypothetical protein
VIQLASGGSAGEHGLSTKSWNAMRRNILIFLWLVLTAGNYAVAAPVAPLKQPTAESAAKARTVKPLIIPAAKAATESAATPRVKSAKAAGEAKAQPTKAKSGHSSASRSKVAPVKPDLSLPSEPVEEMAFGKPVTDVDEVSVLPPMFGEQRPKPSPYQLSGKLITNERSKIEENNYFEAVEGAELSIEFRH